MLSVAGHPDGTVVQQQPPAQRRNGQDLWGLLGLARGTSPEALYAHYVSMSEQGGVSLAQHRAFKILQDPFYRTAYESVGTDVWMEAAGFIDDGLLPFAGDVSEDENRLLVTSVDKIRRRLANLPRSAKQNVAILVSTGAFSPVHFGHLEMMERAKAHLEGMGITVAGGYLSPSHDGYVSIKCNGDAALSAAHRVEILHQVVADNEWLMVDPWEACRNTVPVNFTAVVARLERYLEKHVLHALQNERGMPAKLDVYYVFGADNIDFSLAFAGRGKAICVERDATNGHKPRYLLHLAQVCRPNCIHLAPNTAEAAKYASSRVRAGLVDDMPEVIRRAYVKWKAPRADVEAGQGAIAAEPVKYLLRADLTWACSLFHGPAAQVQGYDPASAVALLTSPVETFTAGLEAALERAFSGDAVNVVQLPLVLQSQAAQEILDAGPAISIDACTQGTHQLRISRLFELSAGQVASKSLVGSPGRADIGRQLSGIPAGEYTFIDDDVATGQTWNQVQALLPAHIKAKELKTLAQTAFHALLGDDEPYRFHDIVDARDFLFGTREGGLVVTLPNGIRARAPYLYPYIDLVNRAKVPPRAVLMLSRAIAQLNVDFFSSLPGTQLKHCDRASQPLWEYLGFPATTTMEAIAVWHLEKLSEFTFF